MNAMEDATERSRLLDTESGRTNPDGRGDGHASEAHEQDADNVPLAEEVSTKELLVVMAAIWMGVFFAALGMRKYSAQNSLH